MNYTSVSHCGNDHQEWIKAIDFYEDDLDLLEGRLVEIVKKNNVHDAMAGVEHFQNQFIVQRNNIDELKHEVNLYVEKLGKDAQQHGGRMETAMIAEHTALHEKYEDFERVMNILRHEFNEYLSKWM